MVQECLMVNIATCGLKLFLIPFKNLEFGVKITASIFMNSGRMYLGVPWKTTPCVNSENGCIMVICQQCKMTRGISRQTRYVRSADIAEFPVACHDYTQQSSIKVMFVMFLGLQLFC